MSGTFVQVPFCRAAKTGDEVACSCISSLDKGWAVWPLEQHRPWVETRGVNAEATTQEYVDKMIEFRQALYEQRFRQRGDALFEALTALLLAGPVDTFAVLSLASCLKRQWHSLAEALEGGELDEAWPRPRARTSDDREPQNSASRSSQNSQAWLIPLETRLSRHCASP